MSKLMSSKFPLVVILSELCLQLRDRDMALSLEWVPRDQNEEADALTNEEFGSFDVRRRIHVDLPSLTWKAMDRLMKVAEELHQEIQRRKAAKPKDGTEAQAGSKRKKGGGLRDRDPW